MFSWRYFILFLMSLASSSIYETVDTKEINLCDALYLLDITSLSDSLIIRPWVLGKNVQSGEFLPVSKSMTVSSVDTFRFNLTI